MGRDLRCRFQSFHFEVSLTGAQLTTLERMASGILSLQFGQVLYAATYSTTNGEITIATELRDIAALSAMIGTTPPPGFSITSDRDG